MDFSLQGSSVCGILQARILGWVAISSSRRSSRLRDQTCVSCIAREFFTPEPPGKTQCVFISMQIASDSFHFFPTPAPARYHSLQITGWWQRPVGVHPTLFCGPANISPPNCHLSLWFRDEELKWKKWKQLGGCSHFVWKIDQCPVSNFLGWEPKELTSKSSVSTPGSRGDAPLAVSSNHTCILFPGLQLGGDAVTRSLSGCKALDVKRSIRPGWTALGVCPWPGDFPSSCYTSSPVQRSRHWPSGPIPGHFHENLVSTWIRTGCPHPRTTNHCWKAEGVSPRSMHSGKEFPCRPKRHSFDSWVREVSWSRKWQSSPVILAWKIPWTEESSGL